MSDLMRDLRHAARRLARTPVFTLATLITLALGIGANTAIFSLEVAFERGQRIPPAGPATTHEGRASCIPLAPSVPPEQQP
jgi:hypothetical protein